MTAFVDIECKAGQERASRTHFVTITVTNIPTVEEANRLVDALRLSTRATVQATLLAGQATVTVDMSDIKGRG